MGTLILQCSTSKIGRPSRIGVRDFGKKWGRSGPIIVSYCDIIVAGQQISGDIRVKRGAYMSSGHDMHTHPAHGPIDRSRSVAIAVAAGLIAMYVIVFCLVTFAV